MPKKPPKPTITLDIDTWTLAAVLSGSRFDWGLGLLQTLREDDPPECVAWRHQREQEAKKGSVTALAELIKFSPLYLACPWTVATIYALRSARSQARTTDMRKQCNAALDCLAQAVCGQGLGGGSRPAVSDGDVANLYGLLLPMYQAAAEGKRLKDVVEYRTLKEMREAVKKQEAPVSALLLLIAAQQDTDSIELPHSLNCYLEGKESEGITRKQPPQPGKIVLWPEFTFTVPAVDLERLRRESGRRSSGVPRELPSVVALERVKALLDIGKGGWDLDWTTRKIRKGRRGGVK